MKEESMTYKAEVHENGEKDPVDVYFINANHIVDAAIEACKKLNAKNSEKNRRVAKVEEVKGKMI
jgi:hypothetical protein